MYAVSSRLQKAIKFVILKNQSITTIIASFPLGVCGRATTSMLMSSQGFKGTRREVLRP